MLKIGIPVQDQPEGRFGTHADYLEFIYNFGHPVMILPTSLENFHELYKIDALLLPGGSDVNPIRYGQRPGFYTYSPNNYMEHFDINILPLLVGKMPIFGICRGLQTLNVYFGGTLHQDLWRHPYSTYPDHKVHHVFVRNESGNFTKDSKIDVNSFHHQGIATLGKDLVIEARTSLDGGLAEAISNANLGIFAVQWHPERLKDDEYSIKMFGEILAKGVR